MGTDLIKQKRLLNEIHSTVVNYLFDSSLNSKSTIQQISSQIDLKVGKGNDLDKIKALVNDYLSLSVKTNSPQFYNQLFSGISVTGYIGELISSITNNSLYTFEMSPVATLIENELMSKMSQIIGYKNGGGTFVSGGSNGNYLAMLAARQKIYPEALCNGMFGSNAIAAFVSVDAHYSMLKAANQIGIGTNNIIKVDVDEEGRMDVGLLKKSIGKSIKNGVKPFFVGATAGTTVRGSFDPIKELADVCKKYDIWFHIDGSWGGAALFSKKHKNLLNGSELSDSFIWCAHKVMAQPLVCSLALFKDSKILFELNDVEGTEYLFHDKDQYEQDLGRKSLQCGRRADALKLWLTWKYFGDRGFEQIIDHAFQMAVYAKEKILSKDYLKLTSDVNFLNVCFQIQPRGIEKEDIEKFTIDVRNELIKENKAMVNYAKVKGENCIRLVTVNHDLTAEYLDKFFLDLESIVKKIQY